ncbi:MAG TPA: response regulator [Burkholderiales bacterium]|nr:response regulator [Burkholderiales bacterium]
MEEQLGILVVDDLPEKRCAFEAVLEPLGQKVVSVATGSAALREVLEHEFAVILLDLNLPDMDGIEVGRMLRGHGRTQHTPIIFVSAYADDEQVARAYDLGAVDYIASPSVPAVVRSKVKAFVDMAIMQRRAKELEKVDVARRVAEEANRRKDEFLAMLSHELRNPLAPLCNVVEILQDHSASDPTVAWAKQVVERQVARLTFLVNDLLDVSRVIQGKVTLKRKAVDLSRLLATCIEATDPFVRARGHTVELAPAAGPLWLHADADRLVQVFCNVLNNAAKYTPEGGRISVAAVERDGVATVTVRDNGIGIDPAFQPRIFELFAQAERTLDRSEGGLGIGLTLVKELVELHGGRVALASEGLGKGTEVRIELPCAAELGDTAPRQAPAGAAAGINRRVLVVEDNTDTRETIAKYLEMQGHEVRAAADGDAALKEALWFQPEVCVLDVGIPKMDGYQLARRLRHLPGLKSALLLAVTGYGSPEDRARAREAGFDRHFLKPASPRLIQEAIDAWEPAPYTWALRSGFALPARMGPP